MLLLFIDFQSCLKTFDHFRPAYPLSQCFRAMRKLSFEPPWPFLNNYSHVIQTVLYRYMLLIPYAWNAFWYREGRQDNLLKINEQTKVDEYRFYQAFLEAAPQFLFQMFLILLESPDRHNYYLGWWSL